MNEQNSTHKFSVFPLTVLAIFVGASIAGAIGGAPNVFIFLAATSLCISISLIWNSLGKMGAKQEIGFEDALELAAPSATEEQKLAVLRALKDLDYELSVGKISREDFDVASSEYRNQARSLIFAQDEAMKAQFKAAEALVAAHLSQDDSVATSRSSET